MGCRGRYQKEYLMALQPPFVCGQPALQWGKHQDCRRPHGAFKHNHDGEISSCGWQLEAGRNPLPRLNQLRYAVIYPLAFLALWHTLMYSPTDIGGFLFFIGYPLRILVWFSRGAYMWNLTNPNYKGNGKTTILRITCIFCIFASSTDLKVRKCRKCKGIWENSAIMNPCTLCTAAYIKNANVPRMPRVIMK